MKREGIVKFAEFILIWFALPQALVFLLIVWLEWISGAGL